MTKTALHAPEILISGQFVTDYSIIMDNGTICDLCHKDQIPRSVRTESCHFGKLVPGFVDIQVNGGGGVLFNDNPTTAAIESIGAAHRSFGTTTFLPTLISDDLDKVKQAIAAVETAIDQGIPGVCGIHLEGPFLNKEKKGIHNACKFRCLDDEAITLLSSLKKGRTLVTLAPEMTDHTSIARLAETGVTLSAGHTNASYEQILQAVKAGITGFTHLYNAMSPFQSRAPGAVGGAFATDTYASLIADGFHIHPAALNHAIKTKGVEKSILITDAMPTVGSGQKEFWLGKEHITTTSKGKCQNDAGVLAGSNLDMATAVRFICKNTDYALEEAITMASQSPARFMKIDHRVGEIKVGKKANFTLLDDRLRVSKTWINGVRYEK